MNAVPLGIGPFIRERRQALGLTQRQLGEKAGIDRTIISQFENSLTRWPRKYVAALAEALEVSEVELAIAAGVLSADALTTHRDGVRA